MSITAITPISAGAALRIFLTPPAGAIAWRILRLASDTFAGPSDPLAAVVHAGVSKSVLDDSGLVDGATYWYRVYYWSGVAWTASASVSASPTATYTDESEDALTVLRDRLEAGLLVEVQRGNLVHVDGAIPVLTAPPIYDDTRFPVVTVHLQNESPAERYIGESLLGDEGETDWFTGAATDSQGWLAETTLTVMGWSLNPDVRKDMRKAIRRVIVANLPVFDEHGLLNVSFTQQDTEDFQSYSAPVYQVMTTFTCKTPILVSAPAAGNVTDVTLTADAIF